MKDIEDLFKEKLAHHSVTPPADTWDKLQASWQQKERKKKGGWLWLAASVVLLLMLGAAFYFNFETTSTVELIAIETPIQEQLSNPPQPETSQIPVPELVPEEREKDLVASEEPERNSEPATKASVPATQEEDKKEEAQPLLAQQGAVNEEKTVVEPLAKIETSAFKEEKDLEAPILSELPKESLIADASAKIKPTVTIIYKSGGKVVGEAKPEEDTKPLEKAVAFFTNIKENGVGFSELRSAKEEFFSKAFSNKREPMAGE